VDYTIGTNFPDLDPAQLKQELARDILLACLEYNHFEVRSIGRFVATGGRELDVITGTVRSLNVSSRNPAGIQEEEPVAVLVSDSSRMPIDVRALRPDFPDLIHMNAVPTGESKSLCLFDKGWPTLRRHWTPFKFLMQLTWWFEAAAEGTLHGDTQGLEQAFLNTGITLVLPVDTLNPNCDFSRLLWPVQMSETESATKQYILLDWLPATVPEHIKSIGFVPLIVDADPIIHRAPMNAISTYDQLKMELSGLGVDLEAKLKAQITRLCKNDHRFTQQHKDNECLVIVRIPKQRQAQEAVEAVEIWGFIIRTSFSTLGVQLDTLHEHEGQLRLITALTNFEPSEAIDPEFGQAKVWQCSVQYMLDKERANVLSDIEKNESQFTGGLLGVGSLGGTLADIWTKSGWGDWIYADPDYVEPHNIQRHIARTSCITQTKVVAVRLMTTQSFFKPESKDHHGDHVTFLKKIDTEKITLDVLIDATASTEVARDLSRHQGIPRSATTFFNVNGKAAVIWLEDRAQTIRLADIEAQYYRAIINENWGEGHIPESVPALQVGATCGSKSFIMSYEKVLINSSAISERLMSALQSHESLLWVNHQSGRNGESSVFELECADMQHGLLGDWRLSLDQQIIEKLYDLRTEGLPNETGGIILGYHDFHSQEIRVVDILPPPTDSEMSPGGFVRGTEGLLDVVKAIEVRTGGAVSYIGEWHSHPKGIPPTASAVDLALLTDIVVRMEEQGEPALMIIVGDKDIGLYLGDAQRQLKDFEHER
jgi:hypothetical protein